MNLNNTPTQSATTQTLNPPFNDEPETLMQLVCEAAEQQKAHDIVVLDVRGQTIVADFFVICAGTSTTHINAVVGGIQDYLRETVNKRAKSEGNAESFWMLLDYNDVIVHVFDEGTREFYDLERLWGEAAITRWPDDSEPEIAVSTSEPGADANADA